MCKAKGALDYQRSMYCYELMLRYWEKKKLPIIELLRLNHTMFSEESGEIALSALTTSQHYQLVIEKISHYKFMFGSKILYYKFDSCFFYEIDHRIG